MESKYYIEVDKLLDFLEEKSDKVPKTPLVRELVIGLIDFIGDNAKLENFCPYGFSSIDEDVCGFCKEERENK